MKYKYLHHLRTRSRSPSLALVTCAVRIVRVKCSHLSTRSEVLHWLSIILFLYIHIATNPLPSNETRIILQLVVMDEAHQNFVAVCTSLGREEFCSVEVSLAISLYCSVTTILVRRLMSSNSLGWPF